MPTDFPGFPPDLFAFFTELAQNNERAWFEANKQRYRDVVVQPLSGFIAAMAPRLNRISEAFTADPRPNGGSMFRIYRDVRFSPDKRPYKQHAACHFRHRAGKDAHAPGYYVHLEPGEVFFGGGIWHPPGPELQRIRAAIAGDADGWSAVTGDRRFKATFDGLGGEALKRAPRGFTEDQPHIADIKRKSHVAMRRIPQAQAERPDFIDTVDTTFQATTPLMRFLTGALGLPF